MSRPKKAVVDYFPHYVSHGKTMFTIESKYGNNGYAFWFKLLEFLGSTEHHFVDCNKAETWEYLLAITRLNEQDAESILNLLAKLDAIDNELWSNKIIRSSNLIDNLSTVYKRREVNVYTKEEIISLCIQKPPLNEISVNINPQSIVEYSKGSIVDSSNSANEFFESVWKLYPKKLGKGSVKPAQKKVLQKHGYDVIKKCVDRYLEKMAELKTEPRYYKDGSTFFNSGYIDYLDENYQQQTIASVSKYKEIGT